MSRSVLSYDGSRGWERTAENRTSASLLPQYVSERAGAHVAVHNPIDRRAPRALANARHAKLAHPRNQGGRRASGERAALRLREPAAVDLLHLAQARSKRRQV